MGAIYSAARFRESRAAMRLTKQTNYAIRMLMYCAANEEELSRIPDIAKAYSVSRLFLFKILQPLVEAGLMQTVRGRNGGVKLARPAREITVADVVRVTEDNFAMAECFENGAIECPLVNACGLNVTLHKALEAFFSVLATTTIADMQRPTNRARLGIAANITTEHDVAHECCAAGASRTAMEH